MTFEKILSDVSSGIITPEEAYKEISQKDKLKTINYYTHLQKIQKEPAVKSCTPAHLLFTLKKSFIIAAHSSSSTPLTTAVLGWRASGAYR